MKRKVLIAYFVTTALLVCGGCSKNASNVNDKVTETTSQFGSIRDGSNISETAVASMSQAQRSDGVVEIITDLKSETSKMLAEQVKSGLNKLNAKVKFNSETGKNLLSSVLLKANLNYDDLASLNQDELYKKLKESGMTDEEIYCYSIFTYLIDASEIGNAGTPADYLTNTQKVLAENGCDYNTIMSLRNSDELLLYLSDKTVDAESLNAKLYFNSLFPGVNVDAKEILKADSSEAILNLFKQSNLSSATLKEKANSTNEEAGQFISKLAKIEEEEKAKEQSKGQTSSGGGTSNTSKSGASQAVSNANTPTMPDGDSNSIVSVSIGNGAGYGNSANTPNGTSTGKNNATVLVGDKNVDASIAVKRIVRGSTAESLVASSNSNLPGHFNTELPSGYDMVAVKFTVTLKDSTTGIAIPTVRVKNLGGTNIETVSTKTFMIQPEDTDYSSSATTKTYWVAFKLPKSQETFSLYFGDAGGTSYVFKSSAITVEGDNSKD